MNFNILIVAPKAHVARSLGDAQPQENGARVECLASTLDAVFLWPQEVSISNCWPCAFMASPGDRGNLEKGESSRKVMNTCEDRNRDSEGRRCCGSITQRCSLSTFNTFPLILFLYVHRLVPSTPFP